MLIIYIQQKRIQYYDSMGRSKCNRYMGGALNYLHDEAKRLKYEDFNPNEWTLVPTVFEDTPQQGNGFDCGTFTITFADFISDNLPLSFSQNNMPLFRKKICANVLRGELKYPLKTLPHAADHANNIM